MFAYDDPFLELETQMNHIYASDVLYTIKYWIYIDINKNNNKNIGSTMHKSNISLYQQVSKKTILCKDCHIGF